MISVRGGMVIESVVNAVKAEQKPYELVVISALYTSLAILLSLWVFKEETSLVMLILTVMSIAPLMINLLKLEEYKDSELDSERIILREHSKAIVAYGGIFLGFTVAFAVWYVFLPSDLLYYVFRVQSSTLGEITGGMITGNAGALTQEFTRIFLNNFKVLIICMLFSLIYGLGAIFVLLWNASVLGTAAGSLVRDFVASSADKVGLAMVATYFQGFGLSVIRYSIHGVPEIAAYLIGGFAGGIISVAIINKHFFGDKFAKFVLDMSNLFFIALTILFIAGILEVWVTPKVFGLF